MSGKNDTPPFRYTEPELLARLQAAGEALRQKEQQLQQLQLERQALQERYAIRDTGERYYHNLFVNNPMPMWIVDFETKQFLDVNEAAIRHYGYTREEFLSMTLKDIRPKEDAENLLTAGRFTIGHTSAHHATWRHFRKNGELIIVEITSHLIELNHKKASLVLVNDITARKNAEERLRQSFEQVQANEQLMKNAERLAQFGSWHINLLTGAIKWSDQACRIYGYESENFTPTYEIFLAHIHPDDLAYVKKHTAISTPATDSMELEFRIIDRHGRLKYIRARYLTERDGEGNPIGVHGFNLDITESKLKELEINASHSKLDALNKSLASSNKELEQFAYVASHDLQEPLRMVSSFLQLLEKRYTNLVDDTGRKYIHFAVDGANRMKQLIQDLLEYSRVSTTAIVNGPTDMNEVAGEVMVLLKDRIDQLQATLEIGNLPVLPHARKTQMLQLMLNLVSNALKYHGDRPPVIRIAARQAATEWIFSVSDNGIGIDPQFSEKVFAIFQRLHHKNEYSGTGIGLSICKKIVEQHGGTIRVESEPGKGSTFYFTLPDNPAS
ncbi:MAG: ATP-binding protein [Chitinophagaceae bacterium]